MAAEEKETSTNIIWTIVKKNWILIVASIAAIALFIWGTELLAAIAAAVGLGGNYFAPNSKPKNRKEDVGVKDKQGFEQVDVVVKEEIELDKKDIPSGIDDDEIDVVIKTDAKVTITDNRPKEEKTSRGKREELKDLLEIIERKRRRNDE